ncbi:MAG: hypothetical protein NVS1B11_32150 [Terriglobales bacterium]
MGLNAPKEVGGKGEGLLALAALTEAIGESCSSSAICFGMHCVGTAVIAAKASDFHKRTFLEPIAEGRHITTLSLSESGTGSQFYISETDAQKQDEDVVINGLKQFVTNGGQANSRNGQFGFEGHCGLRFEERANTQQMYVQLEFHY